MANARRREVEPTIRPARPERSALARPGLIVLGIGSATFLAGCYRAAVELSQGRIHPLVPIAVDAPLAAELLLLVALVVLAAGALLIAAARRGERRALSRPRS